MIRTASEAMDEIARLGYPPIFREIYENRIPLTLVGSCSKPVQYFDIVENLVRVLPPAEHYLPLWETNLEAIVAYDMTNDRYVRHYYGTEVDEILGETYQQFISAFFLELVDSGVWDELDDVSATFQYKHSKKLREFVNSCDDSDFEASNRRFVASITD